jgi:hypothetical protein
VDRRRTVPRVDGGPEASRRVDRPGARQDAGRRMVGPLACVGTTDAEAGGHASAGFSLTQYGHIFDADLDRVADRLDALVDPEKGQGRDKAGSTLVQLPTRKAE